MLSTFRAEGARPSSELALELVREREAHTATRKLLADVRAVTPKGVQAQLAVECVAHEATRGLLAAALAKVDQVQVELAATKAADREAKINALVERALTEGRILPGRGPNGEKLDADKGRPYPSAAEKAIRTLAAADFAAAEALVAAMAVKIPGLGGGLPPGPSHQQQVAMISDVQRRANRAMGISDEKFAKYARNAGQGAEDDE